MLGSAPTVQVIVAMATPTHRQARPTVSARLISQRFSSTQGHRALCNRPRTSESMNLNAYPATLVAWSPSMGSPQTWVRVWVSAFRANNPTLNWPDQGFRIVFVGADGNATAIVTKR